MTYKMPPDLEQRIQAQIESGQFRVPEDVLREALDALEHRQRGLAEIRRQVAEAHADVASGRVGPFDAERTKQAVRRRLREHGVSD